uniref:Uncharacterized protein n=1 Tax=Anguilla anguilla TaxID=7936 RepID=A0A0E9UCR8_ANGAN
MRVRSNISLPLIAIWQPKRRLNIR